jgi:mannose-6-phosphate isomerase-like protein (cupin superfamily)
MKNVERIEYEGDLLAMIVRGSFNEEGIHFFTPDELSQQLGYMKHPAGKVIAPHVHNPVHRQVAFTQEVLVIRSGILRVDFYSAAQDYLESRVLRANDVILLIKGGHGFEVLESVEMLEIKQGPYVGDDDKTRFAGASPNTLKLKGPGT